MPFEFEKKSVNKFNKKMDKFFRQVEKEVTNKSNFEPIVNKAKQGLKENRGLNYQNSARYAEVKDSLKSKGLIAEDKPIQVTGQMIEDLSYKTFRKSPNEILTGLTFDHTTRLRPTLRGMFRTANNPDKPLEEKSEKSSEVAKILVQKKGIPIVQSLANLYSKDFIKKVNEIIRDAFKKV